MKKSLLILFVIIALMNLSCKVSNSSINDFRLLTVTGYSLQDSGSNGMTSINLFFSLKNTGNLTGTIKSWNFKLMHNIITLLEINSENYKNYKLETSSNLLIPPDDIVEFYANTPLPFELNAVNNNALPFGTYTPNEVIATVTIEGPDGEEYVVNKKGSYTFEKKIIDSEKYNILGSWEFTRTINGDTKPKQKITFVGTRDSGNFVIYNFNSGKSEASGTFTVSGNKNITMTSSDGTKYWGEFTAKDIIGGTLLKGTSTGNWIGRKI